MDTVEGNWLLHLKTVLKNVGILDLLSLEQLQENLAQLIYYITDSFSPFQNISWNIDLNWNWNISQRKVVGLGPGHTKLIFEALIHTGESMKCVIYFVKNNIGKKIKNVEIVPGNHCSCPVKV